MDTHPAKSLLQRHADRARERNDIRDGEVPVTRELLVQMHIAEALDGLLLVAVLLGVNAGVFGDVDDLDRDKSVSS